MVLYSTKQSLENKEVSFLALVEIIVAVGLYWYIAYYFDFYWHFIISIIIVPLLLLRSNKSKVLALDLFSNFTKNLNSKSLILTIGYASILIPILKLIIVFSKSIIGGFIFTTIKIPLFLLALHILKSSVKPKITIYILVIVLVFSFVFNNSYTYNIIFLVLVGVVYSIPVEFIFVVSYYKTVSIMKNLSDAYGKFTENWFYNNFILDVRKRPEIIYGIEEYDKISPLFKLSQYERLLRKSDSYVDKVLILIMYFLLYSFALLYRISIKATFWFYLPLLFVVNSPNLGNSQEIRLCLSKQYQTYWTFIRNFFALITLVTFIATYFDFYVFTKMSDISFVSVVSIVYLDFSSIEMWKLFQLLVAILTIGLFVYAKEVYVPASIPLKNNYKIMIIYYANSFRNWILLLYFISSFIFLAYYFKVWEYPYMPHVLKEVLINLLQYIQYKPFG